MNSKYEKIDEMSDFLLKNIKCSTQTEDGDIIHVNKNGKTRIVNVFSHEVTIIGDNGTILYKKIVDENHPIIFNAIQYYKFVYKPKSHIKKPYHHDLLLDKKEAPPKPPECEEFYIIN